MFNEASLVKFQKLDLHDDVLVSILICPSRKKGGVSAASLQFKDDATGAAKLLSFRDCGNLRCMIDFDVLSDNWFAQTDRMVSINDPKEMTKFVLNQRACWHVKYMKPTHRLKPVRKKIGMIRRYTLFRVTFFGGTFEILAKAVSFHHRTATHKQKATP